MIHTADVESLKQKINQLHIEHRDLDDVIGRLSQSPAQDQIQLQRLKKRKLLLKDQIARRRTRIGSGEQLVVFLR